MGILNNYLNSTAVEDDVIKKCESLFYKFIWGKGPERVKRAICIRRTVEGGLGMIDLRTIIRANRIKTLQSIIEGSNEQWKVLPRMYFKSMDTKYGDTYYVLKACKNCKMPEFYKECIEALSTLTKHEDLPDSSVKILSQYLWGNPNITIKEEPLHDPIWCREGIKYVCDLFSNTGEIKRDYINKTISNKGSIILKLNKLIAAIPKIWKEVLTMEQGGNDQSLKEQGIHNMFCLTVEGESVDINGLSLKKLKQILVPKLCVSVCEQYWQDKFGDIEWNDVYDIYNNPLLERKIKEFNWKILNKCLSTENRIKYFAESDGVCKLCSIEDENVEHMLFNCDALGEYWSCVFRLLKCVLSSIKVDEQIFFLGFNKEEHPILNTRHVLNFVLAESKWIVWKRRCIIRYDNKWLTDKQMVCMIESRLLQRIKICEYQFPESNSKSNKILHDSLNNLKNAISNN